MRFFLTGVVVLLLASRGFAGALAPMTVKDISLMLRSGYSSEAVAREVATRHFIGTLDAGGEKSLVQAGATPALINGLKTGAFAIPASELAAVQTELAAKKQRQAQELEESRKLNTLYQAQEAQKRKAAQTNGASPNAGAIASLVKGSLNTSRNGVLRPYLDAEFEKKKLICLYFSASWSAPCRKFTPNLVAFYNRIAPAHPEFEILFVSADRSAAAMEDYMRDLQMPWPALNFDKVAESEAIRKYVGAAIPCLVVVDESGKVIFDTYSGKDRRGPEAVLSDLEQFFAAKGPSQLVQAR